MLKREYRRRVGTCTTYVYCKLNLLLVHQKTFIMMMLQILYLLCNFILLTSEDVDVHNITNTRFRPAGTRSDKQNTLLCFQ